MGVSSILPCSSVRGHLSYFPSLNSSNFCSYLYLLFHGRSSCSLIYTRESVWTWKFKKIAKLIRTKRTNNYHNSELSSTRTLAILSAGNIRNCVWNNLRGISSPFSFLRLDCQTLSRLSIASLDLLRKSHFVLDEKPFHRFVAPLYKTIANNLYSWIKVLPVFRWYHNVHEILILRL